MLMLCPCQYNFIRYIRGLINGEVSDEAIFFELDIFYLQETRHAIFKLTQ